MDRQSTPNGLKRTAPTSWGLGGSPPKAARVLQSDKLNIGNASSPISTSSTPQQFSTPRSYIQPMEMSSLPTPPPSSSVPTTPALLIGLSQSYHRSASGLVAYLSFPPNQASLENHRKALDSYSLLLWAAERCAKRAVDIAKEEREQLEARVRLAEVLVLGVGGGVEEAEHVIGKGLSLARTHSRFASYRWQLEILQIENSVQKGNTKFAKERCKQCLADLTSQRIPSSHAPIYHFYLLLSTLHSMPPFSDYVSSLSSLKAAHELAERRQDEEMVQAVKLLTLRLKMCSGRWEAAAEEIDALSKLVGIPNEPPPTTSKMRAAPSQAALPPPAAPTSHNPAGIANRQLRLQFLILYCVFHSRVGNTKLAKERLKDVHQMLDEEGLEEVDGVVRIRINPTIRNGSPVKGAGVEEDTVNVAVIPNGGMYSLGFLISAVVHRDAFGAKPQSKLYFQGGMKSLTDKLMGSGKRIHLNYPLSHYAEAKVVDKMISPFINLSQVRQSLTEFARIKLDLGLLGVELNVMRSSFSSAHQLLIDLIAFANDYNLFDEFSIRFTLAEGTISHGTGKWKRAEDCYTVVKWMCERAPTKAGSYEGSTIDRGEIALLANISLLVLKFGQGVTININGSKDSRRGSMSSDASLDLLARECIDRCKTGVAHMKLLGNFLLALINGEIVKAKIHLNEALLYSGSVINNHLRAMILSLLASLFLHTREDQANKMLHSAYFISRSMGCSVPPVADILKGGSDVVGEEVVGNPACGLWVGEKLLEIYQNSGEAEKAARQHLYNIAHEKVLQDRLAEQDQFSAALN
ncbi:hypothetical protein BT69DRAFT_1335311 [Atractiella rhizophila]|nr:hypothetical protein BT69DRAFT_1335311 [Atractiella rhizophila]